MPSMALATQVYQQIGINGTASIWNIYQNEEMTNEQVIYIDGEAYLSVSYNDGSSRIMELETYIQETEAEWRSNRGISMSDVAKALENAARYRVGEDDYLSDEERAILGSVDTISRANIGEFYSSQIEPINDVLENHQKAITGNSYEIEALYRTLEKSDPDTYCQSRMEVAKKYGLPSVKCGLHSKRCYNGEVYIQEDGRDFCIRTDNDKDYTPCYNTYGMCGSLAEVEVLESEAESYTPVRIVFSNPGEMTVNPLLRVEIQEEYTYKVMKTFEEELGELKEGEVKEFISYVDNSGLDAGKAYTFFITVSSGRKDILEKIVYKIYPRGTFERLGELSADISPAAYKKEATITGTYTNLAKQPYSIALVAEVFLDGKIHDRVESSSVAFRPGEAKNISLAYTPDEVGNYTVLVKVRGTEMKETLKFLIEKPTLTGLFVQAVKTLPESGSAFSEAEPPENLAGNLTVSLGVFALLVSIFSALKYWRSNPRAAVECGELV
ncbi:MAG: hypothetical protein ACP5E4_03650 [Candidatus Aenigmatarchaeota archaeon]